MKKLLFVLLVIGVLGVAVIMRPVSSTLASSPNTVNDNLEKRLERLERTVQKLALNLERMQFAHKESAVNYDYQNGFSIMRFYGLEPFDGTLMKYVIHPKAESDDPNSEGPTCNLHFKRAEDGKVMIVENFKTLPGSKEKLETLVKQDSCKFPHDVWVHRHSALYD